MTTNHEVVENPRVLSCVLCTIVCIVKKNTFIDLKDFIFFYHPSTGNKM